MVFTTGSLRIVALLAGVTVASVVGPIPVSAQQRLPTLVTVARADSLHIAAVTLGKTMARWGDAARLHRQSALLRAADDSLGFRCLRDAARLSYQRNNVSSARSSMTAAGDQALARGDLMQAAQAYADAAWLAQEQHRKGDTWKLGRQAEVLAGSPLLSPAQRASILKRFTHRVDELAVTTSR
jgi:hypothetical protein